MSATPSGPNPRGCADGSAAAASPTPQDVPRVPPDQPGRTWSTLRHPRTSSTSTSRHPRTHLATPGTFCTPWVL